MRTGTLKLSPKGKRKSLCSHMKTYRGHITIGNLIKHGLAKISMTLRIYENVNWLPWCKSLGISSMIPSVWRDWSLKVLRTRWYDPASMKPYTVVYIVGNWGSTELSSEMYGLLLMIGLLKIKEGEHFLWRARVMKTFSVFATIFTKISPLRYRRFLS